jgi:hypothetical protein
MSRPQGGMVGCFAPAAGMIGRLVVAKRDRTPLRRRPGVAHHMAEDGPDTGRRT